MFALTVNEDGDVLSSFRCSLQKFRKDYKESGNYVWVDRTGFLNEDMISSFITHPDRFVYIPGNHDYDGSVLGVDNTDYVPSSATPVVLTNANSSVVIPKDISVVFIKRFIAAGGAGGKGKGGQGSSIDNVGFFVSEGDVVSFSGSLSGAKYNGNDNTDQPSGNYAQIGINGTTLCAVLGGTGSSAGDVNQSVTSNHDYNWHRGGGGRWMLTPSVSFAIDGDTETSTSVYETYGGGGDTASDGQDGYLEVYLLNDTAAKGLSIFNPKTAPLVRTSYPTYDVALLDYSINASGPAGFGFNIPKGYYYLNVKMMCAGGGAGSDYTAGGSGSYVKNLYYRVMPGQRIYGSVGNGGIFNGDGTTSQPSGDHAELFFTDGDITLDLLYLLGGTGGSKSDGINETNLTNWISGAGGFWKVATPERLSSSRCVFDGSDQSLIPLYGRSKFGDIITVGNGGKINTNGQPGYVNITLLQSLEGVTIDDNSKIIDAQSPDTTTRNLDMSYKIKKTLSFNTPGLYADKVPNWANYISLDYIIAGGGAGSQSQKGGCGAYIASEIISVDPGAEVSYLVGEGGITTSNTILSQPSGSPSGVFYEGREAILLNGGAGGGEKASLNNNYTMARDDKTWVITVNGGEGGQYSRRPTGLTVSNGNDTSTQGYLTPFGGGGDLSQNGESGYVKVTYYNALPAGSTSTTSLSEDTEDNPHYPTDDQIFTQPLSAVYKQAGEYQYVVPDGCHFVTIEQAVGGGGAGSQNNFPNNNTSTCVVGGAGAYAENIGFMVNPQDTIVTYIGKGGTYQKIDNYPQEQGENTEVHLLSTSDRNTVNPQDTILVGLGGGAGASDWTGLNQMYIPPLKSSPVVRPAGEGGEYYIKFSGKVIDGYTNSTASQVTGNGGGGGQAQNGQDGYVKLTFWAVEPDLNTYTVNDPYSQSSISPDPRIDCEIPYSFNQISDYEYAIIPLRHYTHFKVNYIASAGGAGSQTTNGGQGAVAMSSSYFNLGQNPVIYVNVGKGGQFNGDGTKNQLAGGNSILLYSDRNTDKNTLVNLVGGQGGSDRTGNNTWQGHTYIGGHGGFVLEAHPAFNIQNGLNQVTNSIISGYAGGGGSTNESGQSGFISITFFELAANYKGQNPSEAPRTFDAPAS